MPENKHSSPSISRRRLLQGMAALSLSAACVSLFPAAMARAADGSDSQFTRVSSFLVSRPASPILGRRYLDALSRHYPDFPQRFALLSDYLAQHTFAHVDDFLQAVDADDPLRHTAALIIGGWYTGVVGEDAGIELIAYADAMMYLPTKGILVVPTYGGGPDSWGNKPVVLPIKEGKPA